VAGCPGDKYNCFSGEMEKDTVLPSLTIVIVLPLQLLVVAFRNRKHRKAVSTTGLSFHSYVGATEYGGFR
jgi:hypothetical protein